MSLKGFSAGFTKSKVVKHVISDGHSAGTLVTEPYTTNISKQNVSFKSNTKAAINPTSDGDENGRAPQENGDESMTSSTKGGASGDGPTPGYTGSGSGIAELNGSHGNISSRKAY